MRSVLSVGPSATAGGTRAWGSPPSEAQPPAPPAHAALSLHASEGQSPPLPPDKPKPPSHTQAKSFTTNTPLFKGWF